MKITGDLDSQEQFTYLPQSQNGLTKEVHLTAPTGHFTASDVFRLVNDRFIDFISLIDYINTIENIGTLSLVSLITKLSEVVLVDTITNVGTVNLINSITNIGTIGTIGQILSISGITSSENIIRNGNFSTGNFSGWDLTGNGAAIDYVHTYNGLPTCKLPFGGGVIYGFIQQNLPLNYGTSLHFSFWATSLNGSAGNLLVYVYYPDGSSDSTSYTITALGFNYYTFQPTSTKRVIFIEFISDNSDTIWLTQISGIATYDDGSSAPSSAIVVVPKAAGKTTIAPYNNATGATVTVYTVPVGKTFYLCGVQIDAISSAAAGAGILLLNGSNFLVCRIIANGAGWTNLPLATPLPFPAGTVFVIESTAATVTADCTLIGWVE